MGLNNLAGVVRRMHEWRGSHSVVVIDPSLRFSNVALLGRCSTELPLRNPKNTSESLESRAFGRNTMRPNGLPAGTGTPSSLRIWTPGSLPTDQHVLTTGSLDWFLQRGFPEAGRRAGRDHDRTERWAPSSCLDDRTGSVAFAQSQTLRDRRESSRKRRNEAWKRRAAR